MRTIPFMTSDQELYHRVESLVKCQDVFEGASIQIADIDAALEFLNVESPDLAFINFSDPTLDGFALLDGILKDSWLHSAGIVGFCDDSDTTDRLETIQGVNLLASVNTYEVERYLPKILGIVGKNRRILVQRGISFDFLQTLSGSFHLENDAVEANCYSNLLCNFLYNTDRIDAGGKLHISVALVEMLINAIEHGNCGITFEEKSAWLEDGNMMRDLVAKKCADPDVNSKRVLFEFTIAPARSTFLIADEGLGFDWRAMMDPSAAENLQALHGRGIKMTRKYTKYLSYNDKGNQVTFEIEHRADCVNAQPALFENTTTLAVGPGDVVFREGEPGDFLYYIAKGHFEVVVKDRVVSTLSPDDILMGEMAFLLDNRRTATVRASTPGILSRLSKKDFIAGIKAKPHYGLFLARLLAQRLQQRNVSVGGRSENGA